ncbi:UDP-N-acetylmuramate dehydrogenase [Amycolatopsis sp. SID8362]|uniref:UDP-N-acetylmuramate dehydrogenase n=1 Tax=Amycolatopsis sp. SID8362 TaxID=2690346 RepID=UPI001371AE5C|nr:UDP-N-acetylmuramate dehydrogenase [Amycolatopsis sp. SID8362]NBH11059.1 UDP-N-acetylmuramate dehydrogenase [Amycolatopsis sp. SID8362]NED47750.1 UDP-N-acetylmuramate dehydrogenase [Amycolatopsis sp. SID8362]
MNTAPTPALPQLSAYTTLRLGGPARRLVSAVTSEDLVEAVRAADAAGEPVLLLGGGSNLVVADAGFDGTLVEVANTGWRRDGDVVEVQAGQNWDAFVAALVEAGLGGLECLSGIPGSVGATPIQNVGAYGCEVAESLVSVDVYDRVTREVRTLKADELGFAYRTSVLKGTDTGVVLSVRFEVREDGLSAPIRYAELARTLGVEIGARVPAAEAREAVLKLRRGKGMVLDPADHDTWSAGSFFTNPIVPSAEAEAVLERITAAVGSEVPQYPADGGIKLSAAWLIERAGFAKGYPGPGNRVSLSTKHTLALTNRGGATTEDLLALAREVRDGVRQRFGVSLHPEPLLINCVI